MLRVYLDYESLIGTLYLVSENNELVCIYLNKEDFEKYEATNKVPLDKYDSLLLETRKQLDEYFHQNRTQFQLPIKLVGTPFQQAVWTALLQIPYGETKNYQQIATMIENPKAVRAVGQANKANKLPIIVPCHRVIGKNNQLTGYAGTQIQIKEKLLLLEGAMDHHR